MNMAWMNEALQALAANEIDGIQQQNHNIVGLHSFKFEPEMIEHSKPNQFLTILCRNENKGLENQNSSIEHVWE